MVWPLVQGLVAGGTAIGKAAKKKKGKKKGGQEPPEASLFSGSDAEMQAMLQEIIGNGFNTPQTTPQMMADPNPTDPTLLDPMGYAQMGVTPGAGVGVTTQVQQPQAYVNAFEPRMMGQ